MLFALLCASVRRIVPNADSTYIRNVSNLYVSTRRHTHRKKVEVRNFVLFTYFSSLTFWLVLSEFVLKILIFRQDFWISPSRGLRTDKTAIFPTVQVGTRFRREGVVISQQSLCP